MKTLKTCKVGCGKMAKGGPVKKIKKMAAGGTMYGIPQVGIGQTDGKNGMMKKGGATKNGCPPGQYMHNGNCYDGNKKPPFYDGTSAKIGLGIIGAGIAGIGTKIAKDIKKNRAAKKEAKKTLEAAPKKMKMGGSLKPVGSDQKGLSKLPTAVRNKMGYQKKGGAVKRK